MMGEKEAIKKYKGLDVKRSGREDLKGIDPLKKEYKRGGL